MLRSIGKPSVESVESVLKKKKKAMVIGFAEKKGFIMEWKSEGWLMI